MTKSISDYYKLSTLPVEVGLQSALADEQGFFLFGPDASCFGRTTISNTVRKEHLHLVDISPYSSFSHGQLSLPFSIDEIVNNLRLERYINNSISRDDQTALKKTIYSLYYFLRPVFPVRFRKHLQRVALSDWNDQKFPHSAY